MIPWPAIQLLWVVRNLRFFCDLIKPFCFIFYFSLPIKPFLFFIFFICFLIYFSPSKAIFSLLLCPQIQSSINSLLSRYVIYTWCLSTFVFVNLRFLFNFTSFNLSLICIKNHFLLDLRMKWKYLSLCLLVAFLFLFIFA